ncbi:2Fe-2S iron-sulfur cluster-binding protein [Halolamina salifodinae]|uniref:2Fe-2S type ferredoxin n=1 Tax=Halolamina salifodinae TaxID=1202767 RepID=A0A8T4GWF4_9EURY|nr:2Fe-2S iron-sulfur cluster-binding protein [Halolamina salifodinae]MBP1986452.1 2Fe-2S type ferredoxin [Halolamina salifodinae]
MAVNTTALGLAVLLSGITAVLHFVRGSEWEAAPDISEQVLERRAASVPETDFPEPYNRSIGGGAPAAAVGGEAEEGELEGEAEEGGAGPGDIPEDEVEYFEVEFVKQGETVELPNNEPILDAGEEEGFDLPYACRQGQCVSCAAHIEEGPSEEYIEHDDQEMLSDSELDDGYTLTCVAYPRAEFTLETGEAP